MSAAAGKKRDDKLQPSEKVDKSAAVLLFMVAADTTWRMFVPTLGGTFAGLWLDKVLNTEPVCAISGLFIGIVVTAFLVRDQYRKASIEDGK